MTHANERNNTNVITRYAVLKTLTLKTKNVGDTPRRGRDQEK